MYRYTGLLELIIPVGIIHIALKSQYADVRVMGQFTVKMDMTQMTSILQGILPAV